MRSEYKTSLFGNFFSNVASSFKDKLKDNTDRILSSIKTTADGILNTVTKPGQWFKNKFIDPVVDTVKDISDNGWKNSALGKTVTNSINETTQATEKIFNQFKESSLYKTTVKTKNNVSTFVVNNKENFVKIGVGIAAIGITALVVVGTGGAAAAPLLGVAGGLFKSALISGAVSSGINATITVGKSIISGDSLKETTKKTVSAAFDGFSDGFMVGAIVGGVSTVAGNFLKNVARKSKINRGRIELPYGNPNVGGATFLNVHNAAGKSVFRIDTAIKHGLHVHYGATNRLRDIHRVVEPFVAIGAITGVAGGLE